MRVRFLLFTFSCVFCISAYAQTSSFTYQGRLTDNGNPANGNYDMQFGLHNTASGGTANAGAVTLSAVPVSSGLFTVELDFGAGVFNGDARWLLGSLILIVNWPPPYVGTAPRALSPGSCSTGSGSFNCSDQYASCLAISGE